MKHTKKRGSITTALLRAYARGYSAGQKNVQKKLKKIVGVA